MIWQLIAENKRKSLLLFFLMGVLLCLLGFFIGGYFHSSRGGLVGILVALAVWIVQSLIAYFKGDSIFLALSGAKQGYDNKFIQLTHIVEEVKIASGLPAMPAVYIIPEEALNAFAVGRNPRNSAIAVTSGLMECLTRDELQGVVAHEAGHIANRDSLFMMFAGVMLGSIVLISDLFLYATFSPRRGGFSGTSRRDSSRGNPLFGVFALLFALLSPLLAKMLYFSISRKREYLADAMAVQYTRYPEGLASALEKISRSTLKMSHVNKFMTPLFFAPARPTGPLNFYNTEATHPPIEERIRILRKIGGGNPSFNEYARSYSLMHGGKPLAPAAPEGTRPLSNRVMPQQGLVGGAVAGALTGSLGTAATKIIEENNAFYLVCGCGFKLKMPAGFGTNKPQIKCPQCAVVHDVEKYY